MRVTAHNFIESFRLDEFSIRIGMKQKKKTITFVFEQIPFCNFFSSNSVFAHNSYSKFKVHQSVDFNHINDH